MRDAVDLDADLAERLCVFNLATRMAKWSFGSDSELEPVCRGLREWHRIFDPQRGRNFGAG